MLMYVYVFWRAGSVPFLRRRVSLKVLIVAGLFLWAVFAFSLFMSHGGSGVPARMLELFGMNCLGVMFLTAVSLLAVDLVTIFGFIFSRRVHLLRSAALIAGGVLSLAALIQGMRPPVVQEYDVRLPGLPQEIDCIVLVAMSDMHLGSLLGKEWLNARVAQVQAEHPDIIVLLGDIFEGHGEPQKELIQALHGFYAPMGVWAVLGNHEFYVHNASGTPLMQIDGVQVLNNSWAEMRPGLVLAGVEDLTVNRRSGLGGDPILKSLKGRPEGATILLSHTPWQAEKAAVAGAGLMLSGHTHGGQIWPFGYLVRFVYPLFEGRYEVNGMTVIVCRGTGTWGPRMRLWRPGEILKVTLRAEGK
jgi:predicted MPP superfamily phosphohydrolase